MTKNTYMRIQEMFDLVRDALGYIEDLSEEGYGRLTGDLEEDMRYTIETINMELLDSPKVSFCRLDDLDGMNGAGHKKELAAQYFGWLDKITEILEKQYQAENIWEEKFVKLMDRVRYVELDILVEDIKDRLMKRKPEEIERLCIYYQSFQELWGTLDVTNDRFDVIIDRATVLKEHREDFIWLYDRLGDQRSRLVLVSILYSWVTFDTSYILGMKEGNYTDYFDLDLVKCDDEEVVVDLGAWVGDSALNYIQTYGRYKKIYCYEIDSSSMETMKENLSGYPDIEFRNKGVGSKDSVGYMEGTSDSSCNKITDRDTGKRIELVKLDSDIDEKVTMIKMDIEGAEQDALYGAARHIREDKPKLLISVYHNNEDIWKIPRIIIDMDPDYQIYLRSNGAQWGPAEIILLAIHGKKDFTNI